MPRVRNQPLRPQLPGTMRVRGYQTGGGVGKQPGYQYTYEGDQQPEWRTSSCFVAGTPIDMADGSSKNIEDIIVDDEVNTQDGSLDTVIHVHDIPEGLKTLVTINDRITCTDSHPFLTEEGWKSFNPEASKPTYEEYGIEIGQLEVGDNLVTVNGLEEVTELISREEVAKVYNFTTDQTHTYLVDGIVTHNKSYARPTPDGTGGGGRDMSPKRPGEDWFAYHERVGTTQQQGDAARAAAGLAYSSKPTMPTAAGNPSTDRPADARYGVGHGGQNLSAADVAYLRSQGVTVEADGSIAPGNFAAWANENDKRGKGINREAWDAGADTDGSGVLSAKELGAWRPSDARYGVGHGGRNLNANDVAWLRDNQGVPVQADGSIAEADFIKWATENDRHGTGVNRAAWDAGADTDKSGLLSSEELYSWNPTPSQMPGQMYTNQPSAVADMTTMQNPYVFGGYGAPPSMPYAGMATPQIPSIMGMAPTSYYGGTGGGGS